MSKDIVKYHNELNQLKMGNLKDKELDLFYAICLKLQNEGTKEKDRGQGWER